MLYLYHKTLYEGAVTAVKLKGGESKQFDVKVGMHQGSVSSPFLFTTVLEALSREVSASLPFELLYGDDLALPAEPVEEFIEKAVGRLHVLEGCTRGKRSQK